MGEIFSYHDQHFSALTRILQEKCQGVFYAPIQYGECDLYTTYGVSDPQKMGPVLRD
jgi:hypothetical protein